MTANLIPQKSYRIEIGEVQKFNIYLVGTGGTGSFVAFHLARLAYAAKEKNIDLRLTFIDPDIVELKNVGRQAFAPAEVGEYKAVALARRYGYAFGLQIESRVAKFQAGMVQANYRELALVIGCVDNAAARRELASVRGGKNLWWLDSGNSLDSGQVLIGNSPEPMPEIDPTGFVVKVPYPKAQEPSLVIDEPAPAETPAASCAELLVQETQSLMINQAMAGWVAVYASRLILSKDLDIQATYVNLAAGSVRSVPITGEVGKIEVKEEARPGMVTVGREVMVVGELDDQQLRLIYARVCPNCGGALVEGREDIDEVETPILFCPPCDWMIDWPELEAAVEVLNEWREEARVMDRFYGPVIDDEDDADAEELEDEEEWETVP